MKTITRYLTGATALLVAAGVVALTAVAPAGAEPYSPKPRPTHSPTHAPAHSPTHSPHRPATRPTNSTPSRNAQPSRRGVLSLQTTRPGRGGTMGGRCEGTTPGHRMAIELVANGHTYRLATSLADGTGGMTFRVTLPPSVIGDAAMNCMDMTTGSMLSTSTISIGVDAAAAHAPGSNGPADQRQNEQHAGVAYTGAAVIGIGVLGLVLLAGGAFLVVAGRRRAHV